MAHGVRTAFRSARVHSWKSRRNCGEVRVDSAPRLPFPPGLSGILVTDCRKEGRAPTRWGRTPLQLSARSSDRLEGLPGGKGVVILSKVTSIADAGCTAAGVSDGECVNRESYVFTHRLYIGNRSLKNSSYGTPNDAGLDTKGNVIDYYRDASARASGFGDTLALNRGEYAFMAETYFEGVLFSFPGLSGRDIFVRTIF